MIDYFDDNKIELDELIAFGCDGTSVNTGINTGILRRMEEFIGRPLHHIVCLLHTNELPFRHLFIKVDGDTSGPTSFKGAIGRSLPECHTQPLVAFDLINVNVSFPVLNEKTRKDLSRDQSYLYNICLVVIGDPIGDKRKVEEHKIGPLNNSRWLTKASRVLRLYVSTTKDNSTYWKNLHTLATFVVSCYAPVWFAIKCRPFVADAAKHFFLMVKLSRYLPIDLRKVVDKVLNTNYFAGHCESLLIAMLDDPQKQNQAISIIKAIREQPRNNQVRKFRAPSFKFDQVTFMSGDDEYDSLLDLSKTELLTESPLSMKVNLDDLSNFEAPKFSCHTQATERCIRLVSEASTRVIGRDAREGYIVNTMYSRAITGVFDTKRDYNVANLGEIIEAKKKFKKSRKDKEF